MTMQTQPRLKQDADYIFHEFTRSICPVCKRTIDAKVIIRDGKVFMVKKCPDHGDFTALTYSDADEYLRLSRYNKPGTMPLHFETSSVEGCPTDCGLCPEHQQHTCLALIEVNTACNLDCPICFANAGPGYNLTRDDVSFMLDKFVEAEGNPEVVQFSGGEPTIHPELLDFIQIAKDKGVRHIMVNTNGVRIAEDADFAERLAALNPIVYLQFDGFEEATHLAIRGKDLRETKSRALDRLEALGLNVILVAAIEHGINEHEIGAIVEFGVKHPAVRGVNFQPVTHVGRHPDFDPSKRITIPDVIKGVVSQTNGMFVRSDFVPVPCCFPTCQSISYAWVDDGEVTPLARLVNVEDYLDYITNRTMPEMTEDVLHSLESMWSSSVAPGSTKLAADFCSVCELPRAFDADEVRRRIFAVTIKDFLDAYTFNVKTVMKCCIGELVPDGRIIPFCAFNSVGYREEVRDWMKQRALKRRAEAAALRD